MGCQLRFDARAGTTADMSDATSAERKPYVLYSYWRSSCAWRVRIALEWKRQAFEYRAVHLVKGGGEQLSPEFARLNPNQVRLRSFPPPWSCCRWVSDY